MTTTNKVSARPRLQWRAGSLAIGALLAACSASDVEKPAGSSAASPAPLAAAAVTAKDPRVAEWHKVIAKVPSPRAGCFHSTYPSTTWVEVPCAPPPTGSVPSHGPHGASPAPQEAKDHARSPELLPLSVGNGNDYFAQFSSPIYEATGSFPTVTGAQSSNSYTLQLNTNQFTIPATNATCPNCQGWEQGVYSPTQGTFIEYWLLGQSSCPSGWTSAAGGCFQNSNSIPAPAVSMSDLQTMSMQIEASTSGDTLIVTIEGQAYSAGFTSVLGLGQSVWTSAEWGVFGDGNGSNVNLNSNTTIVAEIVADEPPSCTTNATGVATAETNNLNEICCVNSPQSSAISFMESNVPGQPCTICGGEGQTCCSAGPACASASDLCYGQTCIHCGGSNELCCAGNECTAPGTTCQSGSCGAPSGLAASPSALSMAAADGQGKNNNFASTNLTASGAWANSVAPSFAFSGLPAGVACTVIQAVPPYVGSSLVKCTASPSTPLGTYGIVITGTIGDYPPESTTVSLTVTGCQPLACGDVGYVCGPLDNGCGGTVNCGSCPSGGSCTGGACHACADRKCPSGDFFNLDTCECEPCPCGTTTLKGHTGLCRTCDHP